jgi:hypothetical protein
MNGKSIEADIPCELGALGEPFIASPDTRVGE